MHLYLHPNIIKLLVPGNCGFGLGLYKQKDPVSTKGSGHRAQTHDRGVEGTGPQLLGVFGKDPMSL